MTGKSITLVGTLAITLGSAMRFPALLTLILPALLPLAGATDLQLPCPSEMNKVKDILEVNCTGQALSAVPSGLPEDTGILLLNANRLTSVSTAAFLPLAALQDLDLSENGMVAMHTESPLPSLRELLLSRNALVALPNLQGLPALTRLTLAHNTLQNLAPEAFRAVPLLQDLDLRGNRLQTLPQDTFAGLRALKELDLSDNLLEELPRELLQDLEALETLWLSGNLLRTLPTDFFVEGHLFAYVFLTENPWHCDCNLFYLRKWILSNEGSVYQPERGLEKTKVEVAPEKVLCHSPPEHQHQPVIRFKSDCGNVGDTDGDAYDYDEEGTPQETTMSPSPTTHPAVPKEHTTTPHALTQPPLTTTSSPISSPSSSSLAPSTSHAVPASTSTPSTAAPAPVSSTITSTLQPPSTTPLLTSAPPTTFISTTSLTTAVSTRLPSTSNHPQTSLTTSTATSTLPMSTGMFSTSSPTALPSTNTSGASSVIKSSSPLMSTTPVVSTTTLSPHAPKLLAPLNTTHFLQPSPLPPPHPLCPCSTTAQTVPMLLLRAGGEGPQWVQWMLSHCCLLHWVLYLASLVLLLLSMLALACWLLWMCLVGWPSSRKSLQTQEVQYPLLRWRESTESPVRHLSSFQSPLQHSTFCTIKEIELCPEVTTSHTYCTIKDLGIQRSPPAKSSFCTTKELWVCHRPPNASFKSFSRKLTATNLGSLRAPSAYSLDRGVKAIGTVRVKYAGNTL
ncbi:platelet glycoprotein Ib alpha chain [Cygnus atratus]|uniref:platelet glycoprotein Ib alpha chain n=1 Tax=Cygnus atratus TaxID=8868 RepID=UPI0015D5D0B2|nr:platelet glycoprotein Ib alpha chain [Cygnus atratus]